MTTTFKIVPANKFSKLGIASKIYSMLYTLQNSS